MPACRVDIAVTAIISTLIRGCEGVAAWQATEANDICAGHQIDELIYTVAIGRCRGDQIASRIVERDSYPGNTGFACLPYAIPVRIIPDHAPQASRQKQAKV